MLQGRSDYGDCFLGAPTPATVDVKGAGLELHRELELTVKLGRLREHHGQLTSGSPGDLVVLDAGSYTHLAYRPGENLARTVVKGGEIVARSGAAQSEPKGT